MALPLVNTLEGGSNGTTISNANSGGTSGSAFDAVVGTGPTFSTSTPMHGSLGFTPVTTAQSMVTWTTSLGTPLEIWVRWYFRLAGNASANIPICYVRDQTNASNLSGLRINTGSTGFAITSNGSTNVTAFTSTIPTNTWVRFELHCLIVSGTSVTTDGRYFASPDSTQPTETQTTGAVAGTATSFSAIRFGNNLTQTTAFLFDDLGVSGVGWMGPSAPQPVARSFVPPMMASLR